MNPLLEKWVENWCQDTIEFDLAPQNRAGYLNPVDAPALVHYYMKT